MSRASSLPGQSTPWRFVLNTGIVMLGTILSRVLGLVRESILSQQFGTSDEIGVFGAVFTIPDLLYLMIIGGALGSALIPVFSRLIEEGRDDRAWELANTVLTLSFLAFVVSAVLVGIFARPLLAATVVRGYANNPELLNLAVRLLRLMLVQPLLLGLGGLMMALLQSFERFSLPIIASNIYNVSIILAAWLLAPAIGIDALAYGVVGGALLFLLIQIPAVVRAGMRFKPSLNWRMWEAQRVGRLLAPRLVGQGALQINIIVIAALLSLLSAEAQAANRYAYQLLMLPHGIIALSMGTVMFPRLSRLFAANQIDALREVAIRTVRLVLWLAVPAAVFLAVLHVPVVRLLFQRGEFNEESLLLTGRALFFYTPGVIGLAGAEIVIRTFYAMEDTRTPVLIGIITIVINAVFAWALITLVQPDIAVVALSYSATNLIEFVVLFVLLTRHVPGLVDSHLMRSMFVLVLGVLVLAVVLIGGVRVLRPYVPGITYCDAVTKQLTTCLPYGSGADFFWLAGGLAFVGAIGFVSYLAVGILLRAPEISEMWSLLRRRPQA